MKTTLITCLLLILNLTLLAQLNFFKTYKRPSYEKAYAVLQMSDGSYILVGDHRESGYFGANEGYIAKISENGDIINEVIINPRSSTRLRTILPYKYETADYLCIGSSDSVQGNETYGCISFYGLDSNLNIVYQKLFSVQKNCVITPAKCIIHNDTTLYFLADYRNDSAQPSANYVMAYKYLLPFDSLNSYVYPNLSFSLDLYFNKDFNQLNLFLFPSRKKIQLDEDLNYISLNQYNDKFPTTIAISSINDTNYLLAGGCWNWPSTNLQLGCIRYNNNDIAMDSMFYTPSVDTNFYAGAGENTAISAENIFISGFYNVNAWLFPYNYNPSWVTITKTDMDLNMISTHFYGGDAQYCPYSIIPTSDGGCFVTGYSYDYINNLPNDNYELDIFALKVNSDGLITELPGHQEAKAHDAIIYPNPGQENLNIQSGPQINDALFTLFDMQGRIVQEEKINSTQLKLNTSNLPAGIYPWQIVFKNKVIESGKWVKE